MATWRILTVPPTRSSAQLSAAMPTASRTAALRLDGQKYSLPKNNGENTLHGGPHGFNNVVWKAKSVANGVELTYLSKDGEAGFPGNLTATVVDTP